MTIVAAALACVSLACTQAVPVVGTDGTDASDATADVDATPTDAGAACDASDTCCLATHDQAIGRECSPSNPCSPNLDCAYAEGCVEPKGKCQPWGRCPDSGINIPVCQCEGGTGQSRFVPISAYGDACAP
jgi:hypothetical protein